MLFGSGSARTINMNTANASKDTANSKRSVPDWVLDLPDAMKRVLPYRPPERIATYQVRVSKGRLRATRNDPTQRR